MYGSIVIVSSVVLGEIEKVSLTLSEIRSHVAQEDDCKARNSWQRRKKGVAKRVKSDQGVTAAFLYCCIACFFA